MIGRIGLIIALLLLGDAAGARPDPRIRTIIYADNVVYPLTGHFGFQMVIEFGDDEQIENVAIGDSVAWQITPNRRGDAIFLKPIEEARPTNMTVVTSKRRYTFALAADDPARAKPSDMIFVLRFRYPELEQAGDQAEDQAIEAVAKPAFDEATLNRDYSYSGSDAIIPSRLFDDGNSTYFQWSRRVPTPAIFLVGADERESLVNHSYVGDFIVVDRVAQRFVLRLGELETRLYNDGYVPFAPGPDAPSRRERRGFFKRVFGGEDDAPKEAE